MLVMRWGLLRRALPAMFGIQKTGSLMSCLCRLHNFCIDENCGIAEKPLCADAVEIRSAGGIHTEETPENSMAPTAFLGGGAHHEDTSPEERQQFARRGLGRKGRTPRDIMLKRVKDGGFKRPTPKHWA